MARIVLPDAVSLLITRVDIYLDYSRQVSRPSEWNTRRVLIDRDYPEWVGNVTIGHPIDDDEALEVSGWMARFGGQANTFLLEHRVPTLEDGVSATVTGTAMRADGVRTHTLSGALTDAKVGMLVAAADKVYSIGEISGSTVVLDPQRTLPNGTTVGPSTTIEVRNDSSIHPSNPHDKSFWGPWFVSFVEA